MILERGDMFSMWGKTDLFLFTSNPIVNKQGLAVMGRGIAKQLADKLPTIRKDFGDLLLEHLDEVGVHPPAGTLGIYDGQRVGFFMVKEHWKRPASTAVIKKSVDALEILLSRACRRIDLNFPGIGNGKLKREDVLPIIERLPDNVHVWEYGE